MAPVPANPSPPVSNSDESSAGKESVRMTKAAATREDLFDALNFLPPGNTEAFLEAKQSVPDLVEKEANPDWFLQVESYDVSKAAVRMTSYWTERKELFGARAFLPLNLSGEGALTSNEIRLISTGFLIKTTDDTRGRPVLFNDPSLQRVLSWPNHTSQEVDAIRARSMFFVFNTIARENTTAQTMGVVFLRAFNHFHFNNVSFVKRQHGLLEAMPFKVHAMHFCLFPPKHTRSHFIKTTFPSFLSLWENANIVHQFIVHVESTPEMMLKKLKPFGFEERSLPPRLGGSCLFEEYLSTWLSKLGLKIVDFTKPAQEDRKQEACEVDTKRQRLDEKADAVELEFRKMAQLQWLRGAADKVSAVSPRLGVEEGLLGRDATKALSLLDCLARETSSTSDEVLHDPFTMEGFARLLESPKAAEEVDLERQLEFALAERDSLVAASELLSELPCDKNGHGEHGVKQTSIPTPSNAELERELEALMAEVTSNREILAGLTDPVDPAKTTAVAGGPGDPLPSTEFDFATLQSVLSSVAAGAFVETVPWNLAQELPRTLTAAFPHQCKDLSDCSEAELLKAYGSLQQDNLLMQEIGSLLDSVITAPLELES